MTWGAYHAPWQWCRVPLMAQSKYVVQVILTRELYESLKEAATRLAALYPNRRISRSTIARECIDDALPYIFDDIIADEKLAERRQRRRAPPKR